MGQRWFCLTTRLPRPDVYWSLLAIPSSTAWCALSETNLRLETCTPDATAVLRLRYCYIIAGEDFNTLKLSSGRCVVPSALQRQMAAAYV